MAKRFGGKHSPESVNDPSSAKDRARISASRMQVDAAGAKSNFLFLPPVILAFTSLNDGSVGLLLGLAGAAILGLGAWLLREGLRAEAAYEERQIARRPALPRKIIAADLAGIGIGIAAFAGGSGIVDSVIYGFVTAVLHLCAFGIDPLRNKRMEGVDTFQQDRVARVVDEAEAHISAFSEHIETLRDRSLSRRVDEFIEIAREMIRTVENDPRDLSAARKFLGVYLMGARDAAAKFANIYARNRDPDARHKFEALLADLEQNFTLKTQKLLSDDRTEMDIEIKVLRDRLQREGL